MIHTTDVQTWSEFADWLDFLKCERQKWKTPTSLYISDFLFRGQPNADWTLQTTLDRYGGPLDAKNYYEKAYGAKSQIESHTGNRWNIPTPPDYNQWLDQQSALGLFDFPAYEYLVYLRHHGFPSPLLDWSESPYIASFFAFRAALPGVDRVAIYAYLEYAGKPKGGSSADPRIWVRGPYVSTHRRHFLSSDKF